MESVDMRIVEEPKKPRAMNPRKFGMWLFLSTVVMVFASLTSAYIVRRAEGDWKDFSLPSLFTWTSVIIVLSNVTIQAAYYQARKGAAGVYKMLLSVTFLFGTLFLVGQFYAWKQLVAASIYLVGNPSESFVYVLSGLHGLHIVSALIYLAIVWASASRVIDGKFNHFQLELCVTYWHFLGGLWLYLFVFLMLYR